jgi:predicted ATPase with chaperone activity
MAGRKSGSIWLGERENIITLSTMCQTMKHSEHLSGMGAVPRILSKTGDDRIFKVSRTIADMEEAACIEMHHIAEAINYWAFDRKLFGEGEKASMA